MLVPVILAGGSGTRLWPLSREQYPKQLLPLVGANTLFQDTVLRLKNISSIHELLVICNENHRFIVAEQLQQIELENAKLILEPIGRNTAPAVAIAALQALAMDKEAALLVLPADHIFGNVEVFIEAVQLAESFAAEKLITFGIVPRSAETGYGYLKKGEAVTTADSSAKTYELVQFVEKPDQDRANAYVKSGDYYWNSGMFMFKAQRYLDELRQHAPEIYKSCIKSFDGRLEESDFTRVDSHAFQSCPSDSIDYAVMEKAKDAVVIPLDADWNDVGAWSALWEVEQKSADGNVISGDVYTLDVHDSYINSNGRLIAAVGLDNCIIVDTDDAVLVASKDKVQDVKEVVNQLRADNREEVSLHKKVYRPWGNYESIASDKRFQVKRITVKPGAALSLQKHHHRAEHWVVVSGTALITRGDEKFTLSENQSTYIPLGVVHRMENPGKIALSIIEIQSGSYLGEDDIVRLEDKYGRHPVNKQKN